jgi:N-acetylglucosamine-6-phosphate deacetylase
VERLFESGVKVGIGHTAADDMTIESAWRAGAQLSTHLGNGLPELINRHNNPIWAQLAWSSFWTSVIMDGHHLPDAVFRAFFRTLGRNWMILVSDASSLAGMPPGRYREWHQDVDVTADNRIVLTGTPYLAGSASFLDSCVNRAAAALRSEVGICYAIQMASYRPRELLDIGQRPTNLEIGDSAEFVLFDLSDNRELIVRKSICADA